MNPDSQHHQLSLIGHNCWQCKRCLKTWKTPTGANRTYCVGLMHYDEGKQPDHLMLHPDLVAMGLRATFGQKPAAYVGELRLPLYDKNDCVPCDVEIEGHLLVAHVPTGGWGTQRQAPTWTCSVCRGFFSSKPTRECPRVPIYQWEPWPTGLFTRKQLIAKKLIPGPVVGAIPYDKSADGDGWLRLYSEADAKPKEITEKQLAALEKRKSTAKQNRTCVVCGTVEKYKIRNKQHLCEGCICRHSAISAARDALAHDGVIILDLETTGLCGAETLQVSAITLTGETVISTYVKPSKPILEEMGGYYENDWGYERYSPSAFEVNGISNAMVADAPSFAEVWAKLLPLVEGKIMITYGDFDPSQLTYEAKKLELPSPTWKGWINALEIYSEWVGDWSEKYGNYKFKSLSDACEEFNVESGGHDALGDCVATLGILKALAAQPLPEAKEAVTV